MGDGLFFLLRRVPNTKRLVHLKQKAISTDQREKAAIYTIHVISESVLIHCGKTANKLPMNSMFPPHVT